jgi:RNAse (barnase) inhibitor barstar
MTKGLFTAPLRGGVYEVVDVTGLTERLQHAGWHVGQVDLGDARRAVAEIGRELGFPPYYGRNLDALNDSLSELTRPTALTVVVPEPLDAYALSMLDVLTDWARPDSRVPFALVRVPATTQP